MMGWRLRQELVEALQPKLLVVAGNDAKAQRALKDLRTRVTNINVVATMEERAVTLTGSRRSVSLETMGGKRFDIP